ncbi:MAG TPA: propionate catabolism operon regulatory protein PrpR [Alcaligenes sp.]|nr:propionate catabolism operon regulatory protein PrpR [Alcaligenes sp.]HRL28605.1 propionate catabolism operon regulatory protein PrpR [Alcaligenes sp.]
MSVVSQDSPRLRVVAVGLHGLRSLLEELVPLYRDQAEILIVDKAYGEAVDMIQAMRRLGELDVLVSAGSNGHYLREHLDVPVVLVRPGGFDILRGLAQSAPSVQSMAVVTYGDPPPELQAFIERFGLPVYLRAYRSQSDARRCVQELRSLGVQRVLAPGLVVDLARDSGMDGVLLYSQGAVCEALEGAIELARVARAESARRERLNTILAQLRDGVVAVDAQERVETVNPAMEAWLGRPAQELLGRCLSDLKPELQLRSTLRSLDAQQDVVQPVGERMAVVSRTPILEQGRLTGAVLVCQDPAAIQRLDRSLRSRSHRAVSHAARYSLSDLVGDSAVMCRVRKQAQACAQSAATALIIGESGTGKELLAQGMHQASGRRSQPFVAINCAAFPDGLLESELFGYVEGAFTGSSRGGKVGLFEAAHTGTLFLDEIGDMPLSLQTRLLRVLQEKEVLRLGAIEPAPVDVRVIAATHRDLTALVRDGRFRQDLFYRLNILVLHLPPLRQRRQDLPALAAHLADKVAQRLGAQMPKGWVQALLRAGQDYDWPGNIRELENLIERLMVLGAAQPEQALSVEGLVPELLASSRARDVSAGGVASGDDAAGAERLGPESLRGQRERSEHAYLLQVLEQCGGNREQAAARLGISRTTLWRKLRS